MNATDRRRSRRIHSLVLTAALTFMAMPAGSAEVHIGTGSHVDLGTASVDLGCADLLVAGTATLDGAVVDRARDVEIATGGSIAGVDGVLSLTGSWTADGTFTAGNSTVAIVDGCGQTSSAIWGETTFTDLSITSSVGREVQFESGHVTTVTGQVVLEGTASNALVIRSTMPGSAGLLAATTDQSIAHVDVEDHHAAQAALVYDATSTVGANTTGWILLAATVPLLGLLGRAALVGLLIAAARLRSA